MSWRRRIALAITALLGLVVPATAAGAAGSSGGSTTSVRLPAPLLGCDPVGDSVSSSASQILSLVLPRVSSSAPNGTIAQSDSVFSQAEVINLDPLTVEYQLRRGARWADGTKISIADFRATARRGALGRSAAAPQYRLIKTIAPGAQPRQVVLTFKRPTSAWLGLFSPLMAASTRTASLRSCSSPSSAADHSAGPYVISASSPSRVVLVRNPRWKGRQPSVPRIVVEPADAASPLQAAQSDRPVMIERDRATPEVVTALASSAEVSSAIDHSSRLLSLSFRTTGGVTAGLRVRQGIAHMIDRRSLVAKTAQTVDAETSVASSNLVSQGQPGYSGPPAWRMEATLSTSTTSTTTPGSKPTGVELAKQLLTRAGWHRSAGRWVDGRDHLVTLTMAAAGDDSWALSARSVIARQLERQGISVTTSTLVDASAVATALREGRASLGVFSRPTDPFAAHAAAWFSTPSSGPASVLWTGFHDRATDRLAAMAEAVMNPTDAQPTYAQLNRRLWALMPSLPLFVEPLVTAWSGRLLGVVPNPYTPGTLAAASSWTLAPSTRG